MFIPQSWDWRGDFVLVREITIPGDRSAFFAAARRGEYTALWKGVYVSSDPWSSMGADARYRLRITAADALSRDRIVVSNESAAALWRLPSPTPWPAAVHVVQPQASGTRSTLMFTRHSVGLPQNSAEIDGMRVTSLAKTVVDVASTKSFSLAVTMADAALRRTKHPLKGLPRTVVTQNDLLAELDDIHLRCGSVKALRVIEFADGRSDRPGESMSRVSMQIAGLPMPQLQVRLVGASGQVYFVDFWWPQFNLIGEFDGSVKYTDAQFLRGRTPEQALADEKFREDDLRATGRRMSRWGWNLATSPLALRTHLIAAGIR
jgi:hypothetical protein